MGQVHALIIEDNKRNVQVLESLLARQKVTYTHILDPKLVESSLEGLTQVNVVFLDLEMPDINGYEVIKMLKQNPHFANVPIVACTVHITEINTASTLGFHSFLSKPLDAERFPGQLARILNGERVWERN